MINNVLLKFDLSVKILAQKIVLDIMHQRYKMTYLVTCLTPNLFIILSYPFGNLFFLLHQVYRCFQSFQFLIS